MKEDDKTFELLTKMYSEFSKKLESIETDVSSLKKSVANIEMCIEHEIKPKIEVLFDGHTQHTEQLNRIEKEVSRHEEILVRKVL